MFNSLTTELVVMLSPMFPFLSKMEGAPLFVFFAVIAATSAFLLLFTPKAGYLLWQMRRLRKGIHRIRAETASNSLVEPDLVKQLMTKEPYCHLWAEYDDTLHRLKRFSSETGQSVEVRATIPAEVYFTQETLVDSRLFGEFIRHLPGILTGLGIIGTFAGLLVGLEGFTPSEDAASARTSLKFLLDGVGHAFHASAMAIGCAMLITFVEKLSIALCYKSVERLNHEIDALYNTGAGEEYLSRLVEASETSAAQTSQLKDALVDDLHRMMTNIVDRQIESQARQTDLLVERLGGAITGSIDCLGTKIGEHITQGPQTAVQGMMENLLAAFMAKMEDTFGQQMHGINDALQQSMQSMVMVQAALERLVSDIGKTGETVASQMTGQLEETMARAAAGQERMTAQMSEFVMEIRRLLEEQQAQSRATLDVSIQKVLDQVGGAMAKLAEDRSAAAQAEQARQDSFKSQTENLYSGVSKEMAELLHKTGEAMSQSESSILGSMQRSADTMGTVQASLESLVSQLGSAGESATSRMGSAVEEALMQAAAGQELMREQMRDFIAELRVAMVEQQAASGAVVSESVSNVLQQMSLAMEQLASDRKAAEMAENQRQEQLRAAMEQQQSASSSAISQSVSGVLQQIGQAMEHLAEDRKNAELAAAKRQDQLRTQTGELYGGLASEVTALLQKTAEAVNKTETNISKLQEVSTQAIGGMSDGARTMKLAAEQFTVAGNSVTSVIEKSRGVSDELASTANVLQSSASAVKQAFDQYDRTRDTVERYVLELTTLINTAKRESGVNQELVTTMETIVGQLKGVEEQTAAYVLQINEVLRKTFEYFGNSMKTQTEKTIGQTDSHLAGSVQRLGGFLQEVELLVARLAKLNKAAA